MKLMIVDDNADLVQALSLGLQLQWQDCRVVTAKDGEEALSVFYQESPDIILLDVNMPKMDGFEVCRQLKSQPPTADIKVVMLTARGADTDRQQARQAGADDYFVKPFSPIQLLNKVYALLE